MSNEWGEALKELRQRTRLSQGEFSDAVSKLSNNLSDSELVLLSDAGIEHLVLANYELSRYENGRRMPRYRKRFVSLIWALYNLGSIQTAAEANEWLALADQPQLRVQEESAIFVSAKSLAGQADETDEDTPLDSLSTSNLSPRTSSKEPTLVPVRWLWAAAAMAGILLLLAAGIYFLQNEAGVIQSNLDETNADASTILASSAVVTSTQVGNDSAFDSPKLSNNLFSNGDFSAGMSGWTKVELGDGALTSYAENGALCAEILNPGSGVPAVNLVYLGVKKLSANTEYILSANVSVDSPRVLEIEVAKGVLVARTLTEGEQSIELTFVQDRVEIEPRIRFRFGYYGVGKICFDNIVLKEKRSLQPPPTGSATVAQPENILPNGDFMRGLDPWWISANLNSELLTNVVSGELCSEILTPGEHPFDIQFGHNNVFADYDGSPSENEHYLLSFDITKSNADGRIRAGLGVELEQYQEILLVSEPQRVEGLKLEYVEAPYSSLSFLLGALEEGSILCLDNLVLTPADAAIDSP